MNYIDFFLPFIYYGLPSVIIGILVGVICFLLDKFLTKKIKALPLISFLLGVLLYFVYDIIFVSKGFTLSEEVISAGLICGSLGLGIFAFIKNLKSGNLNKSPILSIIQEILSTFNLEDRDKIALLLTKNLSALKGKDAYTVILDTVKGFSDKITESDIEIISRMLYHGVAPFLKNEKGTNA